MYKTVRKGDTSLQYTILPQSEQVTLNGFPSENRKERRSRCIKSTIFVMIIVMINLLLFLGPFLMEKYDGNRFVNSIFGREIFKQSSSTPDPSATKETTTPKKIGTESQIQSVQNPTESDRRNNEIRQIVTTAGNPEEIISQTSDGKLLDSSSTSLSQFPGTTASILEASSSPLTPNDEGKDTPSTTIAAKIFPTEETIDGNRIPEGKPAKGGQELEIRMLIAKKQKTMLKLRENETVPQMFVKAGIASYKQGNLTTSVLARELSLEGLILKSPEGTGKSYPQKPSLNDPSAYYQWKITLPPSIFKVMCLTLMGLVAFTCLVASVSSCVPRKNCRNSKSDPEEPEMEEQEEDKSTLLGSETPDTEGKE